MHISFGTLELPGPLDHCPFLYRGQWSKGICEILFSNHKFRSKTKIKQNSVNHHPPKIQVFNNVVGVMVNSYIWKLTLN